ncbi:MAG: hypothetical protein R3Y23_03735 [Bacillota bacterium]
MTGGILSYEYYLDLEGETVSPVNAGTYSVVVYYKSLIVDNYADTVCVFEDILTIAAITPSIEVTSFEESYTGAYVYATNYVSVYASSGETLYGDVIILYSVTGEDNWSDIAPINDGEYDIKVSYAASSEDINYTDCDFGTYTGVFAINEGAPVVNITVVTDTYDGYGVSADVKFGVLSPSSFSGETIIYYAPSGTEDWLDETPVDVGTYDVKVTYTPSATDNFEYFEDTLAAAVIISKAVVNVYPVASQTKEYDGDVFSGITYTFDSYLVTIDDFSGALIAGTSANVGTYDITIGSLYISDNFAIVLAESTVTITQKVITVDAGTTSFVYTGSTIQVTITPSVEGLELDINYGSFDRVNAGEFEVVVSYNSGNYYLKETTLSYTITLATMTNNVLNDKEVDYNASAQTITLKSIEAGATVVYSGDTKCILGGEYTIIATITKDNYKTEVLTATLTIVQDPQVIKVTASKDSYTYGETPSISVSGAYGKVSFTNSNFTVGSNSYQWEFEPTDSNYPTQTGYIEITINKAEITLNVVSQDELGTITSEDVEAFGSANESLDVVITYTNNSTGKTFTSLPTAAGVYTVTVTYSGSDVYESKVVESTLTVVGETETSMTMWYILGGIALFILLVGGVGIGVAISKRKS